MKKIILTTLACIVVLCVVAKQKHAINADFSNNKDLVTHSSSNNSVASTIIWQDDFSNSSNWIMSNLSIPPLDWSIETDPNLNSAVGVGTGLTPVNFSSFNNGYLYINSDATGGGDNDGTPVEATATYASSIDLSAWPYVQLSFEHNYRWWQDTRSVRVSGDSGLTWTEFTITDANGYPNLQNSGNPEVTTYDISSIAGGQSNVMIQFYYNDNDIWAWYWTVDDVTISEIPDNALEISEEVQGGWWVGYLNSGGDGYDYTLKPLTQLSSNPYSFEAVLRNAGLAPQNTYLNIEVYDYSGSLVHSDISNSILLDLSFPQDTFVAQSTYAPSTIGTYDISMWGIGDSATTSVVNLQTTVTDYIYGRDENNPSGYWRVGRSCGGMVLGVKYDLYADETLYGIDVHINDQSVVGTNMYAILYEDDPNGDPIYLTQTDDYTITAADLGAWVTIPFDGGEQLFNGTPYVAAVAGYANPIDTFQISVSGLSQAGTYIQDNGCDIGSNGFGYWYNISDIPMIRMNFDPSALSIEHMFDYKFSVSPNPSNGNVILDFNKVIKDQFKVNVVNMLGKVVYSDFFNIPNEKVSLDLTFLQSGIYILELEDSHNKMLEKIVIE